SVTGGGGASASAAGGTIRENGYAERLRQSRLKSVDIVGTTLPTTATSKSANATPLPASKHSPPLLRPPTILMMPSTVRDLLCMRRFRRKESVRKPKARKVRGRRRLNN